MAEERPHKHVIILGAGASANSGYPMANELRLRLSSEKYFRELVGKRLDGHPDASSLLDSAYRSTFGALDGAVELFRFGGFATVDEFCRLAANSTNETHSRMVDRMRFMTRFVLGMASPEDNFEASEYYGFVQKLFDRSLCRLRDDVVVMSFNYDPYLEYLLLRAHRQRRAMSSCDVPPDENAMCGGFLNIGEWAQRGAEGTGFALLKLHGCIANPESETEGEYKLFFEANPADRLKGLFSVKNPAILFPWELFSRNGDFSEAKSFPNVGSNNAVHAAFCATWERATREVQSATKVSFIGLSMHEYLEQGLTVLFKGKRGHLDVVMADPLNVPLFDRRTKDAGPAYRPTTPAYHLRVALKKIAPELLTPPATGVKELDGSVHIRGVADFKEFIRTEMRLL